MRLPANENIPGEVITPLQSRGHDVRWMLTEGAGNTDEAVLSRARAEQRFACDFR
ncbi:MAG: DUF5615 family PIN-like protein [Anaerolineales bacterium]|nr:DUF5615 family PIN-like protein [Anaerolineales bacterium]